MLQSCGDGPAEGRSSPLAPLIVISYIDDSVYRYFTNFYKA